MASSNIEKKWILEFLLKQPIEDNYIIPLISALTSSSHQDHNLTKTLLLRRISSQIQNGSISDKILETLELIEEIDHKKASIKTSDSMKEAYYSVVVHCAKKDNIRLRDTLNDLKNRVDDDDDMSENKDSKSVAMAMIRKFLEEARDEIGPSFLDLAAKIVRESEETEGLNGSTIVSEVEVRRDLVEKSKEVRTETGVSLVETILKAAEKELGRDKVSSDASVGAQSGRRREDTIVAPNENVDTNHGDMSGILDVGVCDGKRREKDVSGNVEREDGERVVLEDNQVVRCDNTRNQAARQSLMERNSTAHAFRWEDDDIESSSEGSANPQPPTVLKRTVPSLRKRPVKDQTGWRKKRKWSSIEEQTLYNAVKEYGVGNWALILKKNLEIFEDRQPGDLKDKWRNLTR